MKLLDLAFAELTRSNVDKRHPFRSMVLATHAEFPELRTVIKRNFDVHSRVITFYTDRRTPKCEQIQADSKVGLLFYHPKKKIQLRVYGQATILSDDTTEDHKAVAQATNSKSKSDYMTTLTPGSLLNGNHIIYGDELHLAVVQILISEMDIVLLSNQGHQRSRYTFQNDLWEEQLLVP